MKLNGSMPIRFLCSEAINISDLLWHNREQVASDKRLILHLKGTPLWLFQYLHHLHSADYLWVYLSKRATWRYVCNRESVALSYVTLLPKFILGWNKAYSFSLCAFVAHNVYTFGLIEWLGIGTSLQGWHVDILAIHTKQLHHCLTSSPTDVTSIIMYFTAV